MEARGAAEAGGGGGGAGASPPGKRRREGECPGEARASGARPLSGTVTRLGALGPAWDLRTDRLAVLDERFLLLQLGGGPRVLELGEGTTVEVQGRSFPGMDPGGEGLTPVVVDWRSRGEGVSVTGDEPVFDREPRPRGMYSDECFEAEFAELYAREALLKLHVLRGIMDSLGALGMKAGVVFSASPENANDSLLNRVFRLARPPRPTRSSVSRSSQDSLPPFNPQDTVPTMGSAFHVFDGLEEGWRGACEEASCASKASTSGARSGENIVVHSFMKSEGEWMLGEVKVVGVDTDSPSFVFFQCGHSAPLVLAASGERRIVKTGGAPASGATPLKKSRTRRNIILLRAFRAVRSGTFRKRRMGFSLFADVQDALLLEGSDEIKRLLSSLPSAGATSRNFLTLPRVLNAKRARGSKVIQSFFGCVLRVFHKPHDGQVRLVISGCETISKPNGDPASKVQMGPWLDQIEVFVHLEHVSLRGVVPGAICGLKAFQVNVSTAGDMYCVSKFSSKVLVIDISHVADSSWSPRNFLWPAYSAAIGGKGRSPRPTCVQHIKTLDGESVSDRRAHILIGQLSSLILVDVMECCSKCFIATSQNCSCPGRTSTVNLGMKAWFDDATGQIVVKASGKPAWDLLGLQPLEHDPAFRFFRNLAAEHSRLKVSMPKEAGAPLVVSKAYPGALPMEHARKLDELLRGQCSFAAHQVLLLGQKHWIPAKGRFDAAMDFKALEVLPVSHDHHLGVLIDLLGAGE